MNIVMVDRINELSERKSKLQKIKDIVSNWRSVCIVAVLAITLKSIAESLALMLIRSH